MLTVSVAVPRSVNVELAVFSQLRTIQRRGRKANVGWTCDILEQVHRLIQALAVRW